MSRSTISTSAVQHSAARSLGSVAVRYGHPLATRTAQPRAGGVWLRQSASMAGEMRAAGDAVRDARMARLEAVLLLANEPLGIRKIGQLASLADATEARTLIRRLNQIYETRGTAFRVEEIAGGFQLLSRREFGGWLRRLHQTTIESRLSGPALETLAVVAYRQPVLRADIEAIRGVQCGEMLRQLMERDLVRIVGRAEELGRPFLYGTTKRFLQVFGLRHLDELPRAHDLRPRQSVAPAAAGGGLPQNELPVEIIPGSSREPNLTSFMVPSEESEVSIATPELATYETLEEERRRLLGGALPVVAAEEEDDDEFEDEEEDDDEDDDEDDEEEDDDFDDDFDDDDWEEVDDDDEEGDEDDDEWDEEDDEDWEDDDEDEDEEEEEWEEEAE